MKTAVMNESFKKVSALLFQKKNIFFFEFFGTPLTKSQ